MNKEKLQAGIVGGVVVLIVVIIMNLVWPDETYEDCILSRIKGSHTESAANEIKAACEIKNFTKSESLWDKFQGYLEESELAKCGIPEDNYQWYPPINNVNTNKITSNIKNINIKWRKSQYYYDKSEISFQNNNSFDVEKVIIGFIDPSLVFEPTTNAPDSKGSKFDPDKWLAEKNSGNVFAANVKKCSQPKENFEIIIECKSRYSYGVGAGKYGQLDCDGSIPEKFKEMDACLISASEKSNWNSWNLLSFVKKYGFCGK